MVSLLSFKCSSEQSPVGLFEAAERSLTTAQGIPTRISPSNTKAMDLVSPIISAPLHKMGAAASGNHKVQQAQQVCNNYATGQGTNQGQRKSTCPELPNRQTYRFETRELHQGLPVARRGAIQLVCPVENSALLTGLRRQSKPPADEVGTPPELNGIMATPLQMHNACHQAARDIDILDSNGEVWGL